MGGACMKSPTILESKKVSNDKDEDDVGMHKLAMKSNYSENCTDHRSTQYNFQSLHKKIEQKIQDNYQKSPTRYEIQISRDNNTCKYYNLAQSVEFIKGQFIGTGRLGCVYSGLSVNTGEIVAIKSIKLNKSADYQKQIFAINQAVEKLSQLQHKNIIRYICTQPSENNDEIDIIFEYCNGGSINQLLERYDIFDEKLIKLYVKQILEGLVYLHDQGIVHRNIQNCNVLVDGNGTVKLSDFVVSNILIGDDPEKILFFNTNNGKSMLLLIMILILIYLSLLFLDPPFWMAPEIINKEKNLTWAVDIWSLGCIIIEMATKNPPWSNITTNCAEVMKLIGTSQGKKSLLILTLAPPKFPGHVSKHLKSFLNSCLQKNPLKRPTARKLLEHSFFSATNTNTNITKEVKPLVNSVVQNKVDKNDTDKADEKENKLIKKNMNIHIVEESEKEANNSGNGNNNGNSDKGEKKNIVGDMMATNEGNAFFSLSMTVYSQHSIVPTLHEMLSGNNKDFYKILPTDIAEEEEVESPVVKNNTTVNKGKKFEFNDIKSLLNDSNDNSIQNILESYNMADIDFTNIDNFEKLGTLELKKEDYQKLDAFFKDKKSIGPIERDKVEHFLKQVK